MFNLLIAILSKTFDSISDASLTNYQLLRAQLTINWKDMPAAPPPLRVLRMPYELFETLGFCGGGTDDDDGDDGGAQGCLTLPDGDFRHAKDHIKASVREYYANRADDASAGDRWRVQLNKSITTKLNALHAKLQASTKRELAEQLGTNVDDSAAPAAAPVVKMPMTDALAAEVIQQAFRLFKARLQAMRARETASAMKLMAMMRDADVAAARRTLCSTSSASRRQSAAQAEAEVRATDSERVLAESTPPAAPETRAESGMATPAMTPESGGRGSMPPRRAPQLPPSATGSLRRFPSNSGASSCATSHGDAAMGIMAASPAPSTAGALAAREFRLTQGAAP